MRELRGRRSVFLPCPFLVPLRWEGISLPPIQGRRRGILRELLFSCVLRRSRIPRWGMPPSIVWSVSLLRGFRSLFPVLSRKGCLRSIPEGWILCGCPYLRVSNFRCVLRIPLLRSRGRFLSSFLRRELRLGRLPIRGPLLCQLSPRHTVLRSADCVPMFRILMLLLRRVLAIGPFLPRSSSLPIRTLSTILLLYSCLDLLCLLVPCRICLPTVFFSGGSVALS